LRPVRRDPRSTLHEVDIQGTQEQMDQFLEKAREKGYRDRVELDIRNPSQWRFRLIDIEQFYDQLYQDAMDAGLMLLAMRLLSPS
jgi:hypothetical protein